LGLLTRAPKLIAIVALVCAVLLPLMGSGLNRLTFPLDSLAIFVIACLDVRRRATRESRGTAAPDVEPA
ncbi:MAG: hypothetical protein OER88_06305, partial [Planctomycetota bacterium]|nr:hypothetical protein [Planctomycetota bacterium]